MDHMPDAVAVFSSPADGDGDGSKTYSNQYVYVDNHHGGYI